MVRIINFSTNTVCRSISDNIWINLRSTAIVKKEDNNYYLTVFTTVKIFQVSKTGNRKNIDSILKEQKWQDEEFVLPCFVQMFFLNIDFFITAIINYPIDTELTLKNICIKENIKISLVLSQALFTECSEGWSLRSDIFYENFSLKGSNQINWNSFRVICPFSLNKCQRLYTDSP